MDFAALESQVQEIFDNLITWAGSPSFYAQCGIVASAVFVAFILSSLAKRLPVFREPEEGSSSSVFEQSLVKIKVLIFPLICFAVLSVAVDISKQLIDRAWLIRTAAGVSVVAFLYMFIVQFIPNRLIRGIFKWIVIPLALLHVFGGYDEVKSYLTAMQLEMGNITITGYGVLRLVVLGSIVFWLGRISNRTGQQIIRKQEDLDSGTKEVFVKLFQVALTALVFVLLLQIMGINLTALAVFGGAIGVGLGFGLQSITSNFISGIIILLDRSLSVGDYIELEDGQQGKITELNMRSTTVETFEGKAVMIPNETFITSSFTNLTHKDNKQRYSIKLSVAYKTDLHRLFEILREVVAAHPQVISGPDAPIEERPDAEISGFGDSGVDILIEYWMDGIDDGANRVGADLLLSIWDALHENNIEFPFPQREVRVLS